MFDVGFSEIVFILVIAVVVLGPDKLPEAGRYLGKILRTWQGAKNEFHLRLNDKIIGTDAPNQAADATIVPAPTGEPK